jgi:hypothetical protein
VTTATRGVDSIALLWPGQGGTPAMSAAIQGESFRQARGLLMTSRSRGGIRVMAWPEHGIIKAEGRLSAALDRDRKSWRLASREEVRDADEAMREAVREVLGRPPEGARCEVGRYDLANERAYEDSSDGLAVLAAMSALTPAGFLTRTFSAPGGGVQSVSMVSAGRAVPHFRAYDKGLESGSHAAGERVRFEIQRRLPKPSRISPETLAQSDMRAAYRRTLEPFMKEAPAVVTHPSSVVDELARQVHTGDLTMARAERLAGSAEFLRRYGRGIYEGKASERRLRALRSAGIATSEHLPADRLVPVGRLLADVVQEWSA